MNVVGRSVLGALVTLGLSGCSSGPLGISSGKCDIEVARQLTKKDWGRADVVAIRMRQNEFTPMLVEFQSGKAYILRLVNGDEWAHRFKSPEFFEAVSVAGITEGSEEQSDVCTSLVTIPAGKSSEVRFVPLRDGHYEFVDEFLPSPFPEGPSGLVIIR